jgi:hypothetical protein
VFGTLGEESALTGVKDLSAEIILTFSAMTEVFLFSIRSTSTIDPEPAHPSTEEVAST